MSENSQDEAIILTGKQKKFLKGLAHSLPALVQVGKEGISQPLIDSVAIELERRELLKVKLGKNSGVDKGEGATQLAQATDSCMVQLIGKTIVLYKPNPEKKKEERIKLPKG